MKKVMCPECSGSGRRKVRIHDRYWDEEASAWGTEECVFCAGQGEVGDDLRLAVYKARGGLPPVRFNPREACRA